MPSRGQKVRVPMTSNGFAPSVCRDLAFIRGGSHLVASEEGTTGFDPPSGKRRARIGVYGTGNSRDDEGDALRFLVERRAPVRAPGCRGWTRFGRGPCLEAVGRGEGVGETVHDFGETGLQARLADVGEEGVFEGDVVVLEHARELQELLAAVCEGARHPGVERPREAGMDLCVRDRLGTPMSSSDAAHLVDLGRSVVGVIRVGLRHRELRCGGGKDRYKLAQLITGGGRTGSVRRARRAPSGDRLSFVRGFHATFG